MSNTNDVKVIYVEESVYNTTPVDSTDWKTARFTGEGITATTNTQDSAEIRSDRMIASSSKVSRQVSGNLNFELSTGTFDDLIEATFGGTWTADVLEVGTTKRSFTFEKYFGTEVAKYDLFTGVRVGQMDLDITANSLLTGSFTFMGAGESLEDTSAVGAGTVAAATTNDVLNTSSDVGTFDINGITTGCVSSLSLSVNNNLREINCVGKEFPSDLGWGSSAITGTVEFYVDSSVVALLQSVADNDDVSITFPFDDGVTQYTILLPRVKLAGDTPTADSKDSDLMVSYTFTALLDSVEGTSARITRATL